MDNLKQSIIKEKEFVFSLAIQGELAVMLIEESGLNKEYEEFKSSFSKKIKNL